MALDSDLDGLQQRICQLPARGAAWVAVQSAMRMLPMIIVDVTEDETNNWIELFKRKTVHSSTKKFVKSVFACFRTCQCANAVPFAVYAGTLDARAARSAMEDAARYAQVSIFGSSSAHIVITTATNAADSASAVVKDARIAHAHALQVTLSVHKIHPAIYFQIDEDITTFQRRWEPVAIPLWPQNHSMPKIIYQHWQRLQQVLLELDPDFQYWIDWYEARLRGDPIIWEDIRDQILLTKEQLQQEPAAINAYLLSLMHKTAVRPLNRVRAIFIGPGAAGKTSLLRALHGEPVLVGKEDKTVGIVIRESFFDLNQQIYRAAEADNRSIVVHFWDFGGQVMYHSTHQFFLRSNCIYVLVLDGRQTRAGGSEADYWLEHVKAFAPDAPILMVGNKADLGPMDWDENRLRKKYPNIRVNGFYHLACIQTQGRYHLEFEQFKRDLREALEQAGTVQQKFSEAEFALLNDLRRRSPQETFLPKSEYQKLCHQYGLWAKETLDRPAVLLDLLDKLGVIIHFPELRWDAEDYLLNPRWLTYGVYQIIDRQYDRVNEHEAFECLSKANITDNLGNILTYPQSRCGFILKAIEKFKVAYRLPSSGVNVEYRIPSLLPTREPNFKFSENESRAFQFRFTGLLPPQLLPQLIVDRHSDIEDDCVWRHGVVLRTPNQGGARALLRGDDYDRTLTLWITGKGLEHYFSVLYDKIKTILYPMKHLDYEELILLPITARLDGDLGLTDKEPWARWDNVLNAYLDGDPFYREAGVKYDLKKVLGIVSKSRLSDWAAEPSRSLHFHQHYAEKHYVDNKFINKGQAGAIGPDAKAEGNTFQQITLNSDNLDFPKLATELRVLLEAMKKQEGAVEHFQALNAVEQAEEAAKQQDAPKLLEHLKTAGDWTFKVATGIGTGLAVAALRQAMQL